MVNVFEIKRKGIMVRAIFTIGTVKYGSSYHFTRAGAIKDLREMLEFYKVV